MWLFFNSNYWYIVLTSVINLFHNWCTCWMYFFIKQHNLNLRCNVQNSKWFLDSVDRLFFSVWKALLESCFCSSGIHIKFIFLWQKKNESFATSLYQTHLYMFCLRMREICRVLILMDVIPCFVFFFHILIDNRASLPNSNVYHIWACICCFFLSRSVSHVLLVGCFFGRFGSSNWMLW